MQTDRPVLRGGKSLLVPVLICAALSAAMIRIGFLSLFFLVPLGFCAAAFGPAAAWLSFVFAAFGNAVLSAGLSIRSGLGLAGAGLEILYFTVLALGFTWIMAETPWPFIPRARTAFRFIAASIAGSLVTLGMMYSVFKDENFLAWFGFQIESISSILISSTADPIQQEAMKRFLVPDNIIETLFSLSFRGAALVTMFFSFFINRQIAFITARLIMRKQENINGDLIRFHAPKKTIWVFSICLPVIVAGGIFSLNYIGIAAWNVLIICAILFLAQGGGIVLHFLARRPIPFFMRLLGIFLIVFLLFSPGVNLIAIAALVLLGIAENWLPLRKNEELGIRN
jgi:hypothetical protein